MQTGHVTTPFGRRPMSLAMLAAQSGAKQIPEGRAVDKWEVYRNLCEGKSIIGVGDRALAVLNALLSFYPDSELSEENGLVVFPSNAQLSLRAHGMPAATLRRHLAVLVGCGLIIRRDSPNGKRYARKGRAGDVEEARPRNRLVEMHAGVHRPLAPVAIAQKGRKAMPAVRAHN